MVRDLEQIKENEENQIITKKEKSGNNGHHCKSLSHFSLLVYCSLILKSHVLLCIKQVAPNIPR